MPAALKYNWPAAEHSYLKAPDKDKRVSLKDISNRYRIPYQTVRRYAAKHKWVSRRDRLYYDARKARSPHIYQQHRYAPRGLPKDLASLFKQIAAGVTVGYATKPDKT